MSTKAEWVSILEQQVKENPKFTSYAFATLSPQGKPKCRYVIHRGVTPSSLLLSTTDTRMQKPVQLAADPSCEIAWWIESTAVQFRITGKAYTLSKAKIADAKALEELDVGEDAKYWEDKRMELWEGAMSGHLRASFARPTPGTPLDKVDRQPDEWTESLPVKPEGKDDKVDKEVEAALEHFALVAIKAENVEFLELKCTPNRRTAWNKQTDGSWKKVSVVP